MRKGLRILYVISQISSFWIISVWGKKTTSRNWRTLFSSTVRTIFMYMSACMYRYDIFCSDFFLCSHSPSDASRLIPHSSSGLQTTALHDIVVCYPPIMLLSLWISYSVCLVRKSNQSRSGFGLSSWWFVASVVSHLALLKKKKIKNHLAAAAIVFHRCWHWISVCGAIDSLGTQDLLQKTL